MDKRIARGVGWVRGGELCVIGVPGVDEVMRGGAVPFLLLLFNRRLSRPISHASICKAVL